MARPLPTLLLLAALLAPASAAACTFIEWGDFELQPHPAHGTAPRPAQITALSINRAVCHDIGILSLRLGGPTPEVHGYRVVLLSGDPPPGLDLQADPYSLHRDQLSLRWSDSDATLRRTFRFTLGLVVVDRDGRESHMTVIDVVAGAQPRRPKRPIRRPIPPLAFIAAFGALFALAHAIGWLRRVRVLEADGAPPADRHSTC